ncbi:MAG: hypothetical protein JOZ95_00400 [Solirubrobacterales bacterium]|nr:hypothetical protein [Solirubrobacterales bacterium]
MRAYAEGLPAQQRGALLMALWVNALVTLALQGAQLAMALRVLRRARRSDDALRAALHLAVSPSTAAVVIASAAHELARQQLLRELARRAHAA